MRFYGDDLSAVDLEVRGLRIDPAHREIEASLTELRWFDYQHMHPVTATYCYAHHYVEATRAYYERCIDMRSAEDARAFSPDDIFASRDMTSMWLARQAADRMGLPYPFVLDFAARRSLERYFRRFPRPNQLYGEEFELDVNDAWQERFERQLQFSQAEQFRPGAPETPAVARHREYIRMQIDARVPHARPGLIGRMLKEGYFSAAFAESAWGAEVAALAEAAASRLG
jgi:hypothetical protein